MIKHYTLTDMTDYDLLALLDQVTDMNIQENEPFIASINAEIMRRKQEASQRNTNE